MLSSLATVITYILGRKTGLALFTVLVLVTLSLLSLYAINYIESLYRVYDVFHPIDGSSTHTIIISSEAISPFTSIVDFRYIEEKLKDFKDISIHPVFITIGLVNAEPVVVYELSDANNTCAYPDQTIFSKTKDAWGSFIPIQSLFNNEVLFLRVCGTSEKPGIGVSRSTIAKIRSTTPNYCSFIVIHIYNTDIVDDVYRALGLEYGELERLIRRAFLVAVRRGFIEPRGVQNPTEVYLAKLGIYRDYIAYLAYSIALVALMGLPLLGFGIADLLHRDLRLFMALGVSRRVLISTLLTFIAISTALSTTTSIAVFNLGVIPPPVFIGYSIPLGIDFKDAIYIALSNYFLCTLGAAWRMRELES